MSSSSASSSSRRSAKGSSYPAGAGGIVTSVAELAEGWATGADRGTGTGAAIGMCVGSSANTGTTFVDRPTWASAAGAPCRAGKPLDAPQLNGVSGCSESSPSKEPLALLAARNAGTAGSGTASTGSGAASNVPDVAGADESAASSENSTPLSKGEAGAGAAEAVTPSAGWDCEGGTWPQARAVSAWRTTGAGGGRTSVNDTSGNSGGGAAGSRCAAASKTSLHWPHRTQPSEMRSWSATTLKEVEQDGQRVIWLISERL